MELPPRTRRIPLSHSPPLSQVGTTSAYAENTRRISRPCPARRNYLRVRGEYKTMELVIATEKELPPRTRRILTGSNAETMELGTTSAYAENTCAQARY